ncbi:beta strand repeat-containing protein, partial [Desulfocucumis palustris]|uniref:beta strand repeat-containing protein n=1 Tax=Desulfocucumis palustris TaxID=1898651 RepID=UPI001056F2FA
MLTKKSAGMKKLSILLVLAMVMTVLLPVIPANAATKASLDDVSVEYDTQANVFIAIPEWKSNEGDSISYKWYVRDEDGKYVIKDKKYYTDKEELSVEDEGLETGTYTVKVYAKSKNTKYSSWEEFDVNGEGGGEEPGDVTVTANDVTVEVGATVNADVTATPADAALSYAVADETIATVDAEGIITGVAEGETDVTVTATKGEESVTDTFKVTVSGIVQPLQIASDATTTTVGGTVQFTAKQGDTVVDGVEWSINDETKGVINSAGKFVAAAAGTVVVTAQKGSETATFELVIVGAATNIKLSAEKTTVEANGESKLSVNGAVVDANGNTITNFSGAMTFNYINTTTNLPVTPVGSQMVDPVTGLTAVAAAAVTVPVTNGVATIEVKSTMVAGVTDNLKAISVTAQGQSTPVRVNGINISSNVQSISTVATSATGLKLIAPAAVSINQATAATVTAVAVDQAGQVMKAGTYPVTFTVSGPATVVGGTSATTFTDLFVGNGTIINTTAQVNITSLQGQAGTITVTAESAGLTPATVTIAATQAGSPTDLNLDVKKSTWVQGANTATTIASIDAQVVDASGTPVNLQRLGVVGNGNVNVNVTKAGRAATYLTVGTISTAGVLTAVGSPNASGDVTVPMDATGKVTLAIYDLSAVAVTNNHAGDYTVAVSVIPSTGNNYSIPAKTATVTQSAGALANIACAIPENALNVSTASTASDVVFQLIDAYGNAVKQSGVTVNLYPTDNGAANTGVATLNGQAGVTVGQPLQLLTDAQGQVKVTFAPQSYVGDDYVVNAAVPAQAGIAPIGAQASPIITVVGTLPASLKVEFKDALNNVVSMITSNAALTLNVTARDQYNNAVTTATDKVQITLPAGLSGGATAPAGTTMKSGTTWKQYGENIVEINLVAGVATVTVVPATAGAATTTVTDLTAAGVTGAASITVLTGAVAGVHPFYNGAPISTTNKLAVSANV